jgi:hypothetical protein
MGIAEQVIGSPATVRTHVEHSYEKHSVGESAAAVARAPNRLDPLKLLERRMRLAPHRVDAPRTTQKGETYTQE